MILKELYLFSDLDDLELKELENISKIKNFNSGETIFYEGEKPKYLYILIDGEVKIYKTTQNSKEIVLNIFKPINMIAELTIFSEINFPATALALQNSKLILIDANRFKAEFLDRLALKFISSLIKKIQNLEYTIQNSIVLSATERVAKFIYDNEKSFKELKHKDIANKLNLTPETVSRVLKKFKNNQILSDKGIINRELLKEFIR